MLPLLTVASLAAPPVAVYRSDEPLGARLVLPGDLDGDGHDDLAATCGAAVCVFRGPLSGEIVPDRVLPTRTPPTDPRAAALAPAGDTDRDGRIELWVDGALWEWPGTVLARLEPVPLAGGFDADRDGAHDVLITTAHGRVVLGFGPFTRGLDQRAVLVTGGDLEHPRAWWLPDALGPGRGAIAAECVRDDGESTCPGNQRTLWWAVPQRGETVRPRDAVGWFDLSQPAGTHLASLPDLDGDGRAEVLADDGHGDWALASLEGGDGRLLAPLAPGGPPAAADGCGLDFVPDSLAEGVLDGVPVAVAAGGHVLVVLESPCGR